MSPTKQRTILIYTVIILIMASISWAIYSYVISASLTILTDSASNTIVIQENSPTARVIEPDYQGKELVVRTEAGNYTIIVKNKSTSASQVVNVGIGESKTITLNLNVANSAKLTPQPVTSFGAANFVANSGTLSFIDKNDPNTPLYTVNQANRVTLLNSKYMFSTIQWADPSFGIGLIATGSTSYAVAKINRQAVSIVSLPFTAKSTSTFAVSPNKIWYVCDGHTIYRANGDGSFTKIFTSKKDVTLGSATNDALLFIEKQKDATRESDISILHIDGTKYTIEGELYESSWSPSGDKLLVSSDETPGIYNTSFNFVHSLPEGNVVSPVWLSDSSVAFIRGGNIWRYDLTTGKSVVVSSIDSVIGTPSALSFDKSSGFLYLSIYRTGFIKPTFMLDRINLGSQKLPDANIASRLSLVFPRVDSACAINYMNFTSLSVVYKQTASGENCVSTAKNSTIDSKILSSTEASRLNFQKIQ